MSKTISKLLLNGEEYQIKDAQLSDRVTSIESIIGDGVDVDLSGFYTKTEVDNKLAAKSTEIDTKVNAKVAEVVGGAPEQLDTLKEIADTLNKDKEGGIVNAIFKKIDDNKTEVEGKIDDIEGRLDDLEAVDTDNFITSGDLVNYATKNDVDDKITAFNAGLANSHYNKTEVDSKISQLNNTLIQKIEDDDKDIADGVDALADRVSDLETDNTNIKSRLDTLEAIDHDEYLKNESLNDYYNKTEVDNSISNLATAVNNTLGSYATKTEVNNAIDGLENYDDTAITNRVTALESKKTVDLVQNGVYFDAQPNVMYFVYEDDETEVSDGRTPLKIKVIDNSDGGVDFVSGELITISNEQTQEQFIQPINYFTSGPVDTVLAKETDTISVMCGSAQYGVVAFNGCASNQYIALEITSSTTNRVVNGGVYWLENDQPVNEEGFEVE